MRTLSETDTEKWKPTLKVSVKTDEAEKKTEERQHELEYKAELDEAMRRTKKYESNKFKAYAELWERCSKSMKSKIEARVDFENGMYNDPIKLLQAIKEHSLNYEESRYDMRIIIDALDAYLNCKQRDNESLQDYTKRFKLAKDILVSHLGGIIKLHKIVENDATYDETKPDNTKRLEEDADERLASYLYIKNADGGKYGSLLKGLNAQKSLKNDQFPKKLIDANNALDNHPWDKKGLNNKNSRKGNDDPKINIEKDTALTFMQNDTAICFKCGKQGHNYKKCPSDKKNELDKTDWWINKPGNKDKFDDHVSKKKVQFASDLQQDTAQQPNGPSWTGVHYNASFVQERKNCLKDLILLDSDSNVTIFNNKNLINEIKPSNYNMKVDTNGEGRLEATSSCKVPSMSCKAWYNEESMTNIISLADMADDHRVTMDTSKDKAMFVHLPDKIIRFGQMENRLYGLSLKDPKRHLTKEEYNKIFNENTNNEDSYDRSDDDSSDDESMSIKDIPILREGDNNDSSGDDSSDDESPTNIPALMSRNGNGYDSSYDESSDDEVNEDNSRSRKYNNKLKGNDRKGILNINDRKIKYKENNRKNKFKANDRKGKLDKIGRKGKINENDRKNTLKVKSIQLVSTVKDNKKFLSDSQQLKAKKARKMMQALGTPTTADLKAIIRMNLIKDCKVNTEDVN